MSIIVDKKLCPQNHPCPALRICPANALSQEGYHSPVVDEEKCLECGKCARFCPMGALQIK